METKDTGSSDWSEEGCEEVLRELKHEEAEQPEQKAETIEKAAPQDSDKCPEEKAK